jgi:hypothetical protein
LLRKWNLRLRLVQKQGTSFWGELALEFKPTLRMLPDGRVGGMAQVVECED